MPLSEEERAQIVGIKARYAARNTRDVPQIPATPQIADERNPAEIASTPVIDPVPSKVEEATPPRFDFISELERVGVLLTSTKPRSVTPELDTSPPSDDDSNPDMNNSAGIESTLEDTKDNVTDYLAEVESEEGSEDYTTSDRENAGIDTLPASSLTLPKMALPSLGDLPSLKAPASSLHEDEDSLEETNHPGVIFETVPEDTSNEGAEENEDEEDEDPDGIYGVGEWGTYVPQTVEPEDAVQPEVASSDETSENDQDVSEEKSDAEEIPASENDTLTKVEETPTETKNKPAVDLSFMGVINSSGTSTPPPPVVEMESPTLPVEEPPTEPVEPYTPALDPYTENLDDQVPYTPADSATTLPAKILKTYKNFHKKQKMLSIAAHSFAVAFAVFGVSYLLFGGGSSEPAPTASVIPPPDVVVPPSSSTSAAQDGRLIPDNVWSYCGQPSTDANLAFSQNRSEAWICGRQFGIDGASLYMHFNKPVVITGLSFIPGMDYAESNGINYWKSYRLITGVEWRFNGKRVKQIVSPLQTPQPFTLDTPIETSDISMTILSTTLAPGINKHSQEATNADKATALSGLTFSGHVAK